MDNIGEAIKNGAQNITAENEIASTVQNSVNSIGSGIEKAAGGEIADLAGKAAGAAGGFMAMMFMGKELLDPEKMAGER